MRDLDWRSIESMSEIHENLAIERIVKAHYESKGRDLRILEIGSFKGRSTAILAQFGTVFSIDLHSNIDIGIRAYDTIGQMAFPDFIKNMIRLRLIDRVFPMICTSKILDEIPNMELDVAYIDGCHEEDAVIADIEKTVRHLADDGILLLDDVLRPGFSVEPFDPNHPHHGPNDPWAGVTKAVKRLVALGEYAPFEHYYGLIALKRIEYIKEFVRTPAECRSI